MAANFLAKHGIDLDAELDKAHASTLGQLSKPEDPFPPSPTLPADLDHPIPSSYSDIIPPSPSPLSTLPNVLLAGNPTPQTLILSNGRIKSITPSHPTSATPVLALPSLSAPHIHLDKPYLLSHPLTSHLAPKDGSFTEALQLTVQAKSHYTRDSLRERGAQLLAENARAGVTHLRAFVEVDETVGLMCVEVGLELKEAWKDVMHVQIAVFAQDSLFSVPPSGEDGEGGTDFAEDGNANLPLVQRALELDGVEVLGTTPYVERSKATAQQNIVWAVRTALERDLHLDLHLDYNLDEEKESMVWFVLQTLKTEQWVERQAGHNRGSSHKHKSRPKTVCLGHCTRLTLFSAAEWNKLQSEITTSNLPVHFIALPTSDLFMQGRPAQSEHHTSASPQSPEARSAAASHNAPRCTLHIPSLLDLGLNAALAVNNVGNAFTPFGAADPLRLATWGTGLYQVGTAASAASLFEAVSWRGKEAMGVSEPGEKSGGENREKARDRNVLRVGNRADFVLFGREAWKAGIGEGKREQRWNRQRRTLQEVVWDPPETGDRVCVSGGKRVEI